MNLQKSLFKALKITFTEMFQKTLSVLDSIIEFFWTTLLKNLNYTRYHLLIANCSTAYKVTEILLPPEFKRKMYSKPKYF